MSLKHLQTRLNYYGGKNQQSRMIKDKLRSLKAALKASYQAATIEFENGLQFRGLINPDKLSMDLDCKELSIPYRDYVYNESPVIPDDDPTIDPEDGDIEAEWEDMEPLVAIVMTVEDTWEDMGGIDTDTNVPDIDIPVINTNEVTIPIAEGAIIKWVENNTHWLVLLQNLEETAYFRGKIYRCRNMIKLRNGKTYWGYVRGPVEQQINWLQAGGNYFNNLNYSLLLRLPSNEDTLKYFKRFARISIDSKPWEVQAVDRLSTPGVLNVALKEYYSNPIEENAAAVVEQLESEELESLDPVEEVKILGDTIVYPYDSKTYLINNYYEAGGYWKVANCSKQNIVKVTLSDNMSIILDIMTGRSGYFTLEYYSKDNVLIDALNISIKSL